ncbi:hypothetical protein O181_093537 [Austropuccinia psidii MF-1]|uniref:Uncharacterized protein n=1 Tax=Austropuccinia psidii MF-1 TaxID=1389203 RepID=A0A9Q3PAL1_9BASI|nr:hypothetical protein [Austropuccinia psidii MF-1]
MVHMKILGKCVGELEYGLRSRCIEPCFTEEYINAPQDIVKRTKLGRTLKELDIKSSNKTFIKKEKPKEPLKTNTSNTNEKNKFCKCGNVSYLVNNCLKKAKITQIVETEYHNDKEEE